MSILAEHLDLETYRSVRIADIKERDALDHGLHLQAKTWARLTALEEQLRCQDQASSLLHYIAVSHHGGASLRVLVKDLGVDSNPKILARLLDNQGVPRLTQAEAAGRAERDPLRREGQSAKMRNNWRDPEFREKSLIAMGKVWTDSAFRENQAKGRRNAWLKEAERRRLEPGRVSNYYLPTVHGFRSDIGFYAQSMWEANMARVLLLLGRSFSPSERVRLKVGSKFKSLFNSDITDMDIDFVVRNPRGKLVLYQIAAYPRQDFVTQAKLEMLKKQYPDTRVYVVKDRFYHRLQQSFAQRIDNNPNLAGWETNKDNLRINPDKYAFQTSNSALINPGSTDEVHLEFQAGQSRQVLIERLRRVVSGEVDMREISPIELYSAGMISRESLRRQTVSLAYYLQTHGIKLEERLYPLLCSTMSAGIPYMVVDLSTAKEGRYRVNPSFADAVIETIAKQAEELKKSRYPQRTNDELMQYQQKLLRKGDNQGNWVMISIDEAISEIIGRLTPIILRISYYKNQFVVDDAIGDTLEFLLPYLSGERGDFASFDKFFSFAYVVAKKMLLKQGGKYKLESLTGEETFLSPDPAWSDDLSNQIASLPAQRAAILRFHRMGMNVKTIAEVIGRSVPRAKEIVYESLDAINPDRKKKKTHITNPFNLEVALADYQKVRVSTLAGRQRLPTSYDLIKAHRQGEIRFNATVYIDHFGQCSWKRAQQELERRLEVIV